MSIFLCRFAPGALTLRSAVLKKGKEAPGEKLPALTPVPDNAERGKDFACSSRQLAASASHRFEFQKRRSAFHPQAQQTLSVVPSKKE
jgi:hypothetical protein